MPNKIDFNKKISKMNKSMSLNKGFQCNDLIKDDITNDEKIKISMTNKLMDDSDKNFKSRNFLRKQINKESNDYKKSKIDEECLPENFFKNNIFQYYYSTIEYLKKYYFKSYMNYNINNISKKNTLNIYNVSYINTLNSNIKIDNNIKNNNFINNDKDKKSNFIYNNINGNDKNKTNGSNKNLVVEEEEKINAFSKTEINNNKLNSYFESNTKSNNNEFKNLIININCPSFKPSNLKNKENKNIISESNIISNKVENKNGKENELAEDEYSIIMFGKKGWVCSLCNNFNYEARIKCNRCKSLKNPKKIVNKKRKINNELNLNNNEENNDWICSKCKNLNYSFRTVCNRCKVPKIYQFIVKPIFFQNIIYNNIIRYSPKITPSYIIFNKIS